MEYIEILKPVYNKIKVTSIDCLNLVPRIVNGDVINRGYVVTLLHASRTIRHERCCVAEWRVAAGNNDKQGDMALNRTRKGFQKVHSFF